MDEQLAAIYGTGQEEADLEKTAAAELLVKLAAEEGVDLDSFSDDEIGDMVNDLYSGEESAAEGEEEAAAEGEEEAAKEGEEGKEEAAAEEEAGEKVAEADYLGRVMAHAMTQELSSIEKEAGIGAAIGTAAKATKDAVLGAGKATGGFFKNRPAAYREAGASLKGMKGGTIGERAKSLGQAAKAVAPELGAGAGLAGGAALAMSGKKKKASAIEALADQRAFELAKEAGYIDDDGAPIQKQASELDLAVEQRALEICQEAGLPVEWNE